MTVNIDLNADLGEYDDPDSLARDGKMMRYISSANIACGGHAGNDHTMVAMLNAASRHGVAVGAHPSYPDRENFGRKSMVIGDEALLASLIAQIETLRRHTDDCGARLTHVKPHGQLYNDAARDTRLATLIATATKAVLPDAALVGLAGSISVTASEEAGLRFIGEAFADRRYDAAGFLVPRSTPDAVIASAGGRIDQALAIAHRQPVETANGGSISIKADTICLHSDSDGALKSARDIRSAFEQAGINISAPR